MTKPKQAAPDPRAQAARRMKLVKFGYGLVTTDGEPWWSENCVCEDRAPMQDVAQDNNEYDGPKIKVVTLYRKVTR